jgi:hypothetical protein
VFNVDHHKPKHTQGFCPPISEKALVVRKQERVRIMEGNQQSQEDNPPPPPPRSIYMKSKNHSVTLAQKLNGLKTGAGPQTHHQITALAHWD